MKTFEKRVSTEVLKTGIVGFDTVLCGGFKHAVDRAMSIILKGPHGAGKTTFGLQFACNLFNGVSTTQDDPTSEFIRPSVAYFTLEQRASDMKIAMRQFDWRPRQLDQVVCLEDFTEFPTLEPFEGPTFFISQFPQTALGAYEELEAEGQDQAATSLSSLTDHVRNVLANMCNCKLIVIDSISDPFDEELNRGSYRLNRTLFQELCALGEEYQATILILLEKNELVGWRDFVPDVVVELGWQEFPAGEFRRYLQVEKGRFQEILDGRHELRIEPGRGIVVNPILSSVLRSRVADRRNRVQRARSLPFCVNADFNRILGAEYAGKILEGTSTLLYGPDATRKKAVITQFLHQGVLDNREEDGHVLFVVAGSTVDVAIKTVQQYLNKPQVLEQFFELETFLERIKFLPVSGFAETINEITQEIGILIDRFNISRIAFDDVAAIFSDPKDILPLKEYCTMRGITSLFVETVEHGAESTIREHFDSFIRSRHLILPNGVNSRVGYQVKNIDGSSKTSGRSWELEFQDGQLHVRDSFREYVEDREGRLHLLPLRLSLYGEYPYMEEFWKREAFDMFNIKPDGTIDRLQTFVSGGFDRHLESFDIMANRIEMVETWACNVDEFALDHLVANNKLEPLDPFIDQLDENKTEKFHPLALQRGRVAKKQFGIPHRIDFGVYTVRTDLLEQLGADPNKVDWTFDEMIEVGSRAQSNALFTEESNTLIKHRFIDEIEEGGYPGDPSLTRTPVFDFFASVDESFLACILEILWPFLFDGDNYLGFDHPDVESAVFRLRDVLSKLNALPKANGAKSRAIVPAVFQRNWIVSHWEVQKQFAQHAEHIRFIRPPKLQLDATTEPHEAVTIAGEWYLALISGSPNPGRGMWAIRALTSKSANQRFYENHVGLPAIQQQFAKALEPSEQKLYENSKSRRLIPNYFENRSLLLTTFRKIFSAAPGNTITTDEHSLRMAWKHMLEEIQS